jgi:hypothetical protein
MILEHGRPSNNSLNFFQAVPENPTTHKADVKAQLLAGALDAAKLPPLADYPRLDKR